MISAAIYLIVIVTCIWVLIDAHRRQITPNLNKPYSFWGNGALAFVLGCAVLWIIMFPVYLYRRARQLRARGVSPVGGTVFGVIALVAAILCIAALFIPQQLSAQELSEQVGTSMRATFQKNPALSAIHVKSVALAHENGTAYKGLATLESNGKEEQRIVDVTYDGKSFSWKVR